MGKGWLPILCHTSPTADAVTDACKNVFQLPGRRRCWWSPSGNRRSASGRRPHHDQSRGIQQQNQSYHALINRSDSLPKIMRNGQGQLLNCKCILSPGWEGSYNGILYSFCNHDFLRHFCVVEVQQKWLVHIYGGNPNTRHLNFRNKLNSGL